MRAAPYVTHFRLNFMSWLLQSHAWLADRWIRFHVFISWVSMKGEPRQITIPYTFNAKYLCTQRRRWVVCFLFKENIMSWQELNGKANRKFLIFMDYIDWLCLWKGICEWDNEKSRVRSLHAYPNSYEWMLVVCLEIHLFWSPRSLIRLIFHLFRTRW